MRRRKEPVGCPVCLVSEAMIVVRGGKKWSCRGCGSDGTFLNSEKVVLGVPADDPFDWFNRRGKRGEIVRQIEKDKEKIERERAEAAA